MLMMDESPEEESDNQLQSDPGNAVSDTLMDTQKSDESMRENAGNQEAHSDFGMHNDDAFRPRSISTGSNRKNDATESEKLKGEAEIATTSEEIPSEIEEYIKEKYIRGWNAKRIRQTMVAERMKVPSMVQLRALLDKFRKNKCMELLAKKKETDEKISQQASLVANLGKALDEGMQQAEEEEKQQKKYDNIISSESNLNVSALDDSQSSVTRARRSRRLYSPSPPSSLIAETGRKKKKDTEVTATSSTSSHSLLTGKRVGTPVSGAAMKWAKLPPSTSLSSSLESNGFAATKEKSNATISSSSLSASHGQQRSESAQSVQPNNTFSEQSIQLIRQNEKLTRENVQLKQKNQEQQQQIQALIGANRELIWAFNESRREHDELMQQLRDMAQLVKDSASPSNIVVPQYQQNMKAKGGVRQKRNGTTKAAEAGNRPKKRQQRTGIMFVAENTLPPSLAILKKHNMVQQQTTSQAGAPQEIAEQPTTSKEQEATYVDREAEIAKIKQQLENMTSGPDINKFIGGRKPAFYTPKEYGDWHSTMSSMLRKQYVQQLFEALCPEFAHTNVMEFAKQNPHRADFIQRSLNFAYETENELFVGSSVRPNYLFGIADKIYTLREAKSRQQNPRVKHNGTAVDGGHSAIKAMAPQQQQQKRTLADLLKPKRAKPSEDIVANDAI